MVDPVIAKGPMMAFEIQGVQAIEILDSRGRPTLMVTATLADGTVAEAGVPRARRPEPARPWSSATAIPHGSAVRESLWLWDT